MYYFDYASTTKPSPKNVEIYSKLLADHFLHSEDDNSSGKLIEECNEMLLSALQTTGKVIYTSGGTEANNQGIIGFAKSFSSPKHFITTKYEHSSVHQAFKYLESIGHDVTYLDVDQSGVVDYQQLQKAIRKQTVLVSIMAVNNEVGSLNDVRKIRQVITDSGYSPKLMIDCVQVIGKVPIDYHLIDIITLSGHKLYAHKGIGAIIIKDDVSLQQIIYGGEQQDGFRPGSFCVASAATLAIAVREQVMNTADNQRKIKDNIDYFLQFIESNPRIKLNCPVTTNICSIFLDVSMQSESMVTYLKQHDIYVSSRSACSKKLNVPSRTLVALGMDNNQIDHSLRISFSANTTKEEIDYLQSKLSEIVAG